MGGQTVIEFDLISAGGQAVWFAATLLFIVYVGLNRRWWKNIWAKMFVSLDIALWFLDLPNCLHQWFGLNLQNDFYAWYDVITVWGVVFTILWRAAMIIYIQLTRETREREWELQDGQVSRSEVEGRRSERSVGGDDIPPAVCSSHPGGE